MTDPDDSDTPGGGLIRMEAEGADSCVTRSVVDSGPGIPLEERDRVFDRSYRGLRSAAPLATDRPDVLTPPPRVE